MYVHKYNYLVRNTKKLIFNFLFVTQLYITYITRVDGHKPWE